MRTLSLALLLIASMAFVVPGCSENSSSVVTPSNQSLSLPVASVALEKGGVVHSATGGGHVSDFWGQEFRWTFSFSAREFGDGGCSGEVQFVDHTGVRFHGTIIDLNVIDNKAKLCWTSTSGPWVGLFGCAVVEDNGEGQNASGPDMMTGILWTDVQISGQEPSLGSRP